MTTQCLSESKKTTSYYFLRESGDMIWTRPEFKPNKNNEYIKEVWEIDHSDVTTLITALVDGLTKGAKISSVDDVIKRNKGVITAYYDQYALENDLVFENKGNDRWLARKLGISVDDNVVRRGFGKSPIHAAASLAAQPH